MKMKKICVGILCYNEVDNVKEMYTTVTQILQRFTQYEYDIIFADNSSTDGTVDILREIASEDKKVKVILNQTNFGPQRSGYNLLCHFCGDALISLPCDFQDPPELINEYIKYWEEGYQIVWGQKVSSKESKMMYMIRTLYYKIIGFLSETPMYEHVTGTGILDKAVVEGVLNVEDASIGAKTIAGEYGYKVKLIPYVQNKRQKGKSGYSLNLYFSHAMKMMINTSTKPLRLMTIWGMFCSFLCAVIAVVYLVLKLIYWNRFDAGMTPVLIGLFFMGSVQLLFLGVIGEYLGVLLRRVSKKAVVIEKELLNFDEEE